MATTRGLMNTCTKLSISLLTCTSFLQRNSPYISTPHLPSRFLQYSANYIMKSIHTAKFEIIVFVQIIRNSTVFSFVLSIVVN